MPGAFIIDAAMLMSLMSCIVDIMSLSDVVICMGCIMPPCVPWPVPGIIVGIIVGEATGMRVGIIVGAMGIPCAMAGATKARTTVASAIVVIILFNPTICITEEDET